jgi:hypothetical protein
MPSFDFRRDGSESHLVTPLLRVGQIICAASASRNATRSGRSEGALGEVSFTVAGSSEVFKNIIIASHLLALFATAFLCDVFQMDQSGFTEQIGIISR